MLQGDVGNAIAKLSADFDAETNAVAAKLDAAHADLAKAIADLAAASNSPASPETVAALAALESTSARLKLLGADPAAPIPAPVT